MTFVSTSKNVLRTVTKTTTAGCGCVCRADYRSAVVAAIAFSDKAIKREGIKRDKGSYKAAPGKKKTSASSRKGGSTSVEERRKTDERREDGREDLCLEVE
ncbi:hypothetical protein ALC62_10839 [Cyphomyrmex costatus]|uniref:Uncharacterized protein n=1 Tax=Cyphomyrmex costatus TaxID=456900 RepID=A0A195CCE7_9HYME|nr:hypothetical protein ALC62_10839 [Cyphomyrmex costatus]